MENALFIDFGSTYTKVTVVDLNSETVLGTARAFSTVETDIMEGFLKALKELERSIGLSNPPYKYKVACSSAAGGLRMIAIGLIPDLTAEAAKRAALGAGARIINVFAHELTKHDLGKIEEQKPDIILLAGGTNGGNKEVILHNARVLTNGKFEAPVIVAGNSSVAEEISIILTKGGKDVRITENVMPEINVLNIDPAQKAIRKVFLEKIVEAKGLKKAETFIDSVLMPTPAAVLKAAELLAKGCDSEKGLGDLLVVDVGGATTDVHSIARGEPTKAGVSLKGLPEPFAKRTVEGDLGMRYSAKSLLETTGIQRIKSKCSFQEAAILEHIQRVSAEPETLCNDKTAKCIDTAMAFTAVDIATERHAGKINVAYTPFGASYIQNGKDLTQASCVIGTGGVIVFHQDPLQIMKGALFDSTNPMILKPMTPKIFIDKQYILAAMGLLAGIEPIVSLRIMKKYLVPINIPVD